MRKFSLLVVAAMLLSTGNLFANDLNNSEPIKKDKKSQPVKKLSVQIAELLDNNFVILENKDLTANVRFTVNAEKEIVVLSVDTKNDALEGFVKGRLNYKKVSLKEYREGRTYTVPVRITE